MAESIKCPNLNCGATNPAGAAFCFRCGTKLKVPSIAPTNDLERDLLDNALSDFKKGIDNRLLANNLYVVPVDAHVDPKTEKLGIRVMLAEGENQETVLYVYTSGGMFNSLLLPDKIRMYGGEYYRKTGQFLTVQWSLKEIVAKCDEMNVTGLNVNTGCGKFEAYLSVKDAKALLIQTENN